MVQTFGNTHIRCAVRTKTTVVCEPHWNSGVIFQGKTRGPLAGLATGTMVAKLNLLPADAPEAALGTMVFFAAIYLAARTLSALEHNLQQ